LNKILKLLKTENKDLEETIANEVKAKEESESYLAKLKSECEQLQSQI